MYKFIFTFIETNEYGNYWSYETNKRKVEIIAKDKNEALQKLEKIGVHNYKNLQWDAIEIIGVSTESNLLVSYIEELQQENKLLKEKYLNAVADYEYEKCKNQKAIKHLEEHYSDFPDGMKENYDEETIKILKGE